MRLNALELDALTEIFNHGVGQAARSLSQLAGDEVLLSVPKVQELAKRDITDQLDAQGMMCRRALNVVVTEFFARKVASVH